MTEVKLQAPNYKSQTIAKDQAPNHKQILSYWVLKIGILNLEFVWNLKIGIWNLGNHG